MNKRLCCAALLLSLSLATNAFAADLTVKVSNIDEDKGDVRVVIYDAANYLTHHASYTLVQPATPGTMSLTFKDLPAGEWAILAYHDANSNQDLDRNFLGIPTEQFGFSNNPGYSHKPSFEETRFAIADQGETVDIKLSDK